MPRIVSRSAAQFSNGDKENAATKQGKVSALKQIPI